jgi:2-oxoglutarate ferredoxin oxidoreductase subunit alpha
MIREWAFPGMAGFEHRIGGLEKMAITGTVSYVPENHEVMVLERAKKIEDIANYIPEIKIQGEPESDLVVVGWGGTYGHLLSAISELKNEGKKVALLHFNYINPLPRNTEDVLKKYKKILVTEINDGQFFSYLRSKFPQFNYTKYNKIQGLPFTVQELKNAILKNLEE